MLTSTAAWIAALMFTVLRRLASLLMCSLSFGFRICYPIKNPSANGRDAVIRRLRYPWHCTAGLYIARNIGPCYQHSPSVSGIT
jgi:hypothetical protein